MTWYQLYDGILRRWRLVTLTSAICLLFSVMTYKQPVKWYQIHLRFIVGQIPADEQDIAEKRYWEWASSEYVTAAISDWSNGSVFAAAVSKKLIDQYPDMDTKMVMDNMTSEGIRSQLTTQVVHTTESGVIEFAQAVINAYNEEAGKGIPQLTALSDEKILPVRVISTSFPDKALVEPYIPPVGVQMDLPQRLLYSLLSGFILAMVLTYFDPLIRHGAAVEQRLKLPLLGEIPPLTSVETELTPQN